MDIQEKVACILPSAGSGERMGLTTPKQFCVVAGKHLICHTVEGFLKIPWINPIIVVAAEQSEFQMKEILKSYMLVQSSKILIVTGGSTRHKSIAAGIQALKSDPPEFLIIHDGVRPQVPGDILRELVVAARKDGAAGVSRPLVSTVLAVDDENYLSACLDRSKFLASEMPQVFRFTLIQEAYSKCTELDFDHGTECLNLVLTYCNTRAKVLPGTPELWKVTHMRDLYAAEHILKDADNYLTIIDDSASQEASLGTNLLKKFKEKYKINLEYNAKQVYIHNEETVSNIVKNINKRTWNGERIVHITHDKMFIGNSESVEVQRKARKSACVGVIICCSCSRNRSG